MTTIFKNCRPAISLALSLLLFAAWAGAESPSTNEQPAAPAVSLALGVSAERKVDVAWNRYYTHAGLSDILVRLNRAFPELTKVYSIGKSTEGRDLWCIEVTARKAGNPDRKPGIFYLVPMVNPDGRDFWLADPNGARSARTGSTPIDNDRDGVADEDDCEDLNGDGVVTLMRIKDPLGRYKAHPD